MAPSAEGLGRELDKVASADPAKFLSAEPRLHKLHPVYVRSIISGIAGAVKAGRPVDDGRFIDLLSWAGQQEQVPFILIGEFSDKDWNGTRRAIVDAVTAMMANSTGLVSSKPELS